MKQFTYILFCIAAIFCSCSRQIKEDIATEDNEVEAATQEVRYEYGIAIDSFIVAEGHIKSGETLGKLFGKLGATTQQISDLNTLSRSDFDTREIRAGKPYLALYDQDSTLHYFVYIQSAYESIVLDVSNGISVKKHQKEIIAMPQICDVVIETSLWNSLVDNGIDYNVALTLSEIYAWTIDFFDLRKGDRVKAYYDCLYVDSLPIGIGQIYAAGFIHRGDTLQAYRYENGDTHGYFNEQGESLRKAFLKAPLNYKRISSRFTYARKHPIFKTVRPHTGVDYAAPFGTPVVTIGDGTVIEKGYKGGGGNTVKIRHNGTYTTAYLHLSKYGNIKVGQHVKQGEVIGYVGSTGNSTGPHLDFRVWKNGTPVDPLHLESPKSDPVPTNQMADFRTMVDSLVEKIQL